MYFDDHNPPHFHVKYSGFKATISIEGGEVIVGYLPPKQLKLVQVWAEIHQSELFANFESMKSDFGDYKRINPL